MTCDRMGITPNSSALVRLELPLSIFGLNCLLDISPIIIHDVIQREEGKGGIIPRAQFPPPYIVRTIEIG